MRRFTVKKKQPRAVWTKAFKSQAAALHPEAGPSGGLRARSGAEAARQAVYLAIRKLFLERHGFCLRCAAHDGRVVKATEIHHQRGKLGMLLFDVRHFSPLCSGCHREVHDHPEQAVKDGWLSDDWNKQDSK